MNLSTILAVLVLAVVASCKSGDKLKNLDVSGYAIARGANGQPIASASRNLNGDGHEAGEGSLEGGVEVAGVTIELIHEGGSFWRVTVDGHKFEGKAGEPLPREALQLRSAAFWARCGLEVAPQ